MFGSNFGFEPVAKMLKIKDVKWYFPRAPYRAEKKKGKEPPVFLSTHPSSQKRIANLKNWINEVIIKYQPIKMT